MRFGACAALVTSALVAPLAGCGRTTSAYAVGSFGTWAGGNPVIAPRARTSVTLVVTNQCTASMQIYVIRAGARAQRLGVVNGASMRVFDATRVARVGSAVRFVAVAEDDSWPILSEEIPIRRAGSLVIDIGPVDALPLRPSCRAGPRTAVHARAGLPSPLRG